jgi:hypothetical protein
MAAFAAGRLLDRNFGVKTPLSMSPISKIYDEYKSGSAKRKKRAFEAKNSASPGVLK